MKITEAGQNFKKIVSTESADHFESKWPNLLVCFSVGDVYTAIANYFKLEGLPKEVRDDFAIPTLCKATEDAFVTLLNRGALDAFIRVSPLPPAAQDELDRMAGVTKPAAEPEVGDDHDDVVAQCASDFRALGADAFKRRWMNDPTNRQVYEQAIAAGRI